MNPDELGALLRASIRAVQALLPGGVGVTILIFDYDEAGDHAHGLGYISSAPRQDMLRTMLEFIEKNLDEALREGGA